jgi:glycosyltransferase involved in cell wall biosynthesis
MNLLFIHQNFPGQYLNLAPRLARDGHNVLAISSRLGVQMPGIKILNYEAPQPSASGAHPFLEKMEEAVVRGQRVADIALRAKRSGLTPDVICLHPGWGESLYLRDVWPGARQLHYCEFYFHSFSGPSQFRPRDDVSLEHLFGLRTRNSLFLLALNDCEAGVTPTYWQHAQFPLEFRSRIAVVHDGINVDLYKPRPDATITLPGGRVLSRADRVVTYVSRNLEPARGFPEFIRAVELLQRREDKFEVLIIGGDEVSYGPPLPKGQTWREKMLKEVDIDQTRLHFLGKIPYMHYLSALQVSSAHVYLTVPYVLSWSLLEAMSAGCVIVGSDTEPVREVIDSGRNGFLVDFFDTNGLAQQIAEALRRSDELDDLREAARERVREQYSLARCLPRQMDQIERLAQI